jgi:hypothetical protein
MATRRSLKINAIRSHLKAIDALFQESDEKLAAARDGTLNLAGPDTDVISPPDEHQGAMDSGRARSMSEAFPGFTMNGDLHQPKKR